MKDPDRTVYLIDSSIYMFRAWHILPDTIVCPEGNQVNVVYGFADFLAQLLQQTQSRYVVCAFDKSLKTSARNKLYPPYKANRPSAPEQLKRQFKLCQTLVSMLGISGYDSDLYEADDIIGTIAESTRQAGMNACIVSADKDLTQFVRDGDEYWNYARGIKLDAAGVKKRFGVSAEQIADMLAICGDKVDNIPGIPGVGESTAAKLLAKWHDLDSLFDNIDKVALMKFRGAPRVSALLAEHEETVRLARKLTGLLMVPDLPTDPSYSERKPIQREALESFLISLGFSERRRHRIIRDCSVN